MGQTWQMFNLAARKAFINGTKETLVIPLASKSEKHTWRDVAITKEEKFLLGQILLDMPDTPENEFRRKALMQVLARWESNDPTEIDL